MSRYKERSSNVDMPIGFGSNNPVFSMNISNQSRADVNNGRNPKNRPDSPCTIIKGVYYPKPCRLISGTGVGYVQGIGSTAYSSSSVNLLYDVLTENFVRCTDKMQRVVDSQIGSFSTLNFLYELREVGDTFKKLKTPEDFRFIDYQFGIAPLVADIKAALSSYDNAVASLNEKMKKYRSIPCTATYRRTVMKDGHVSYDPGWFHYQQATYRVTTRMSGEIVMDVPIMSQVCPQLYAVLDSLSIDVSASNAWNALPFSWLVDWFVPVGDFLEALPSTMKPLTRFRGCVSHSVFGVSRVFSGRPTEFGESPFYLDGEDIGTLEMSYYNRTAFADPLSSLIRWRMDSLSKPSQVLLLRDILFPADIKRGKSIFR